MRRQHVGMLLIGIPVVLQLVTARASAQNKPPASATISELDWLAGDWIGEANGVVFEERWTPAAGGAMLATARTIKANQMVGFEFLRIIERDGGLVYIAQPGGRPQTDFTMTEIGANSATFENPNHDFPKMIRYALRPDGDLEARISDGGQRGQTFIFRRASR